MNNVPCCQCGKIPALYQINGNPLCIDCAHKAEQIKYMQQAQYMQEMNHLSAEMESIVGIPDILPRYEIPKPPPIIKTQGGLTLNNIKVSQSVIGAINTGNVQQIDVALTNIKNGGNDNAAQVIKQFTEAMLQEKAIDNNLKNQIIEQLLFLASQASIPADRQKKSIINVLLENIKKGIEHVPTLLSLFEILKKLFGA